MTSLNIYIMKNIILSFKLAPNPTRDNHQTTVESTGLSPIQAAFNAFDSLAWYWPT